MSNLKGFASIRFATAATGLIAAVFQFLSLAYWVFVVLSTLGMAFDSLNDTQSKLVFYLPFGTLAGAITAIRFPVVGGIVMGAAAIAYPFFSVPSLSFGLDGLVGARANSLGLVGLVPACIGIVGGAFLWVRDGDPQPEGP